MFTSRYGCLSRYEGAERESLPIELEENTMVDAFFKTSAMLQPKPRVHDKRHHSIYTTDAVGDARARKKEMSDLEAARRASLFR